MFVGSAVGCNMNLEQKDLFKQFIYNLHFAFLRIT